MSRLVKFQIVLRLLHAKEDDLDAWRIFAARRQGRPKVAGELVDKMELGIDVEIDRRIKKHLEIADSRAAAIAVR
jgi:hypothetical protein